MTPTDQQRPGKMLNYVAYVYNGIKYVYQGINPVLFSGELSPHPPQSTPGAIDVVVVEQEDGTYRSTPFQV